MPAHSENPGYRDDDDDESPPTILRVRPLTREAFAAFGEVIEATDPLRACAVNAGTAQRYDALASIDTGPQGRAIVSIFRSRPRELPFPITTMERHPLASQAFMPLSGRPWLVVVAPAGEPPVVEGLVAFLAHGNQGVNYAPGVWHHPLLALDAVCDFLVIDRTGPGNNCDETTLTRPGRILAESVGEALCASAGSDAARSNPGTPCAGSN